jgi:hypothetical protein
MSDPLNPDCVCGHRWSHHNNNKYNSYEEIRVCWDCNCEEYINERELDDDEPTYRVVIEPGGEKFVCTCVRAGGESSHPALNLVVVYTADGERKWYGNAVCGNPAHFERVSALTHQSHKRAMETT